MDEELTLIMEIAEEKMTKILAHLNEALLGVRAGKATPHLLKGIMVEYYGAPTPLDQVSSITIPDAKTILIQPWERNLIGAIDKAILVANIGLTPSNNGEFVRLSIPPLTEDRRKELVKQVRTFAESAKVNLRNARRDAVDSFKKAQKDGMEEDVAKDGEVAAQKLIDHMSKKVEEVVEAKELEIMTV